MSLKREATLLAKKLTKKKQTLGIAESCTGGLISAVITEIPGVSSFFYGGLVSYANHTKQDLLGVRHDVIAKLGAVSSETALQMARGARKIFKSDWAVAVTGIAGPTGGTKTKPVGLVFFSVVGPKIEFVERRVFKGSRKKIQTSAAQFALALLNQHLQ